jgi:uncharacterized protein YxeA
MKKKILITICAIIVLGVGAFLIWTKCPFTKEDVSQPPVQEMEIQTGEKLQQETMASSSL